MESTPDEDTVKTIEMLRRNLEYYLNLVDIAVAEFEKTEYNFERSSATVDKMLSDCIVCYLSMNCPWKEKLICGKRHGCPSLRKCNSYPNPTTTLIGSHQQQGKTLSQ